MSNESDDEAVPAFVVHLRIKELIQSNGDTKATMLQVVLSG